MWMASVRTNRQPLCPRCAPLCSALLVNSHNNDICVCSNCCCCCCCSFRCWSTMRDRVSRRCPPYLVLLASDSSIAILALLHPSIHRKTWSSSSRFEFDDDEDLLLYARIQGTPRAAAVAGAVKHAIHPMDGRERNNETGNSSVPPTDRSLVVVLLHPRTLSSSSSSARSSPRPTLYCTRCTCSSRPNIGWETSDLPTRRISSTTSIQVTSLKRKVRKIEYSIVWRNFMRNRAIEQKNTRHSR